MTATVQPASVKLTDAKGQEHYYPLNPSNGKPMPMEPAQYAEFVKLGGPKAVYDLQMENSPHRIDFGRPDTFAHDWQQQKAAANQARIDHPENFAKGDTPEEVEKNRRAILEDKKLKQNLDRANQLAEQPRPLTDDEIKALAPKSWDEWNRRAVAMQQGWNSLGYDLVQIRQTVLPTIGGDPGTEPVLEVRLAGTSLATYSGPLAVLENRLRIELQARARRDEAIRQANEYRESKRQEMAEAIANSPAAKLARLEAEREADKAELAELNFRLNQLNQRATFPAS
jgi:hypothetical protein